MRLPASLDSYAAERADFENVLGAIRDIGDASLPQLRDLEWLLAVIRRVGLVPIPEFEATYQGEEEYVNASQQGLIQLPREFARWLLLAGEHQPASYLEIGCFNGASASIATAYLERFNPAFQATTIDVWPAFIFYSEVRELVPLNYVVGKTSFDFVGQPFEAVFIDGDHTFDWAWADYQNVGRAARICGLHDVNNAPYRELPLGGVCGVWERIKHIESTPQIETHEIFEHPAEIMGIGVRLRRE